jgi:hypothetical protein
MTRIEPIHVMFECAIEKGAAVCTAALFQVQRQLKANAASMRLLLGRHLRDCEIGQRFRTLSGCAIVRGRPALCKHVHSNAADVCSYVDRRLDRNWYGYIVE